MADDFLTLSELQTINGLDVKDYGISDLLNKAPLIKALAADEASNGTVHKYEKEVGAPVVGFRAPNTGRDWDTSEDEVVTVNLKVIDASFGQDKALVDEYKHGKEAYLERESVRHLRSGYFLAEQQFIYGTGNDADGFSGMADADTVAAFDDEMVINAGGSTANTGSSVWLIRTNGEGRDVMSIAGRSGDIEVGEAYVQMLEETGTEKKYPGYVVPITGWLGLQVGSKHSMARIINLTEDAGKGLTDELIYRAFELFPASEQPDLIVMNRRSMRQLRESRTATNATGAPAPRPREVDGVPIIQTDSIVSTEAISA